MGTLLAPKVLATRKAVIYVRISDPKQKVKGDGIRSQESACRDYARYNNMQVVDVYVDVMSGKYAARPKMGEMLEFLGAHHDDHYAVIIDDISRLARNYIAHIGLREEIRAAGGELYSPSMEFFDDPKRQTPEKITAIEKEQERIDNADRTLSRQIARTKNGYYTFPAPTGFKYTKDKSGQGGRVLVRNEPVASIVADVLEKFASGYLGSQAEVKRYLESNPAFPKGTSAKIGKSRVKTMLTQPIYAGHIDYAPWGIPLRKAQNEALISLKTYLKIQDHLNGKPKHAVRLDINPAFPLRGLILCSCETPLRAGRSKGRSRYYHYYACHTKSCEHYGKSIKQEKIQGEFAELVINLRPAPELFELLTVMFKDVWRKHVSSFKQRHVAAIHSLKGVEKKIDNLVDRIVKTSQPTLIGAYEAELIKLETQKLATQEQINEIGDSNGVKLPDFENAYRTAMHMLANPLLLWESCEVSHKRSLVKMAFGGRLKYYRNLGFRTPDLSLPFQIIQRLTTHREENYMNKSRMVVCAVFSEPVSHPFSLFYREFTGKICVFGTKVDIINTATP